MKKRFCLGYCATIIVLCRSVIGRIQNHKVVGAVVTTITITVTATVVIGIISVIITVGHWTRCNARFHLQGKFFVSSCSIAWRCRYCCRNRRIATRVVIEEVT
jgi:hypothetical protein